MNTPAMSPCGRDFSTWEENYPHEHPGKTPEAP